MNTRANASQRRGGPGLISLLAVGTCMLAFLLHDARKRTTPPVLDSSATRTMAAPADSTPAARTLAAAAPPLGVLRHPVTVRVAPASAAAPDDDWLHIPRTSHNLIEGLVHRPATAATMPILRSTTFNPRDLWVPVATRIEVAQIITNAVPLAMAMQREFELCRASEFDAALARGEGTIVDLVQGFGKLQMQRLGPDPFFGYVDGVNFGFARNCMPRTSSAQHRLRLFGCNLVDRLADAFATAANLTPAEHQAIRKRARLIMADS